MNKKILNACNDDDIIMEYYKIKNILSQDDRCNPMSYDEYNNISKYYFEIINIINERKIGYIILNAL